MFDQAHGLNSRPPFMESCARVRCSPVAKAVLMTLALDADPAGMVRITVPLLAAYVCMTERSVTRAIRQLEKAGHLTRYRSLGKGAITELHPRIGDAQ